MALSVMRAFSSAAAVTCDEALNPCLTSSTLRVPTSDAISRWALVIRGNRG